MPDIKTFYYSKSIKEGDKLQFGNSDFHHMRDVLKLKENSIVYLLTQDGKFRAILEKYQKTYALITVGEKRNDEISLPNIHLIQGIPKGWKMDEIIEKATEMGVSSIIPVYTSRSIPNYSKEEELHKIQRWEKIAISASKQSRRDTIPSIQPICNLQSLFDQNLLPNFGKIIFWEVEQQQNLFVYLKQKFVSDYFLLIGPEGGISHEEADLAFKASFQSCSLGRTILRTETASPFAIGLVRYTWNIINAESLY